MLVDAAHVDPDHWGIRCRTCGDIFSMGDMLRAHTDRQRNAPPGMYYAKCPTCGKEDYLTRPEVFLKSQSLRIRFRNAIEKLLRRN